MLHDRQPEPGSSGGPRPGRIHPVEPLEDPLKITLGDPDPLVGDADLCGAAAVPGGRDHHPGLFRAVGDRVLQQHVDGRRPRVDGVLDQFLDHGGRTLDDFTGRDLIDQIGRKDVDTSH